MMIQASSGQSAMILRQQVDEHVELVGGIGRRVEALAEPMVAPGQDLGRGRRDLPRQHRDICRRALRAHPGHLPRLGGPLLGQRRLAVARTRNQHAHLRA